MIKKDKEIAQKFKSLISQRAAVHEIIVFGSRAREEGKVDSDLDILVVVESLDRETEKFISDSAWEAGFPQDVVVVPVTISKDFLENSPIRESVFIKNVHRDGVRI